MDIISFKIGYQNFISKIANFGLKIPKFFTFNIYLDFCKKSQADKVLWHLEHYGTITNMQCHEIYGIRHAPSVIRQLRNRFKFQGNHYKIDSKPKQGSDRWGNPCIWAEYTLLPTDEQKKTA